MCSEKCAKILFVAYNIIFLFSGLALLGVGIYGRVNKTQYDALFGASALMVVCYILIGAGVFVVLISLTGCLGAFRNSKLLLGLYLVCLVFIFIVQLATGIVGLKNYDTVLPLLKENTEKGIMDKYGYDGYKAFTIAIDLMQMELECCGFNGPTDWQFSKYYTDNSTADTRGDAVVPISCCIDIKQDNCNNDTDPRRVHSKGCVTTLLVWGQNNLLLVGGVSIGIAMIQLFGMACAICLWKYSGEDAELY